MSDYIFTVAGDVTPKAFLLPVPAGAPVIEYDLTPYGTGAVGAAVNAPRNAGAVVLSSAPGGTFFGTLLLFLFTTPFVPVGSTDLTQQGKGVCLSTDGMKAAAWQTFRISLFNIADLTAPSLLNEYLFGEDVNATLFTLDGAQLLIAFDTGQSQGYNFGIIDIAQNQLATLVVGPTVLPITSIRVSDDGLWAYVTSDRSYRIDLTSGAWDSGWATDPLFPANPPLVCQPNADASLVLETYALDPAVAYYDGSTGAFLGSSDLPPSKVFSHPSLARIVATDVMYLLSDDSLDGIAEIDGFFCSIPLPTPSSLSPVAIAGAQAPERITPFASSILFPIPPFTGVIETEFIATLPARNFNSEWTNDEHN
jgi:hypothetical protein